MKSVRRSHVPFSLLLVAAAILAGSSFFGSEQAGAYQVQVTSWTTITSFTTASSTVETGIEIQMITIIGVVVVAAVAAVAALSRFVRKPSLTLPTKPTSQFPGGSGGRLFYEGSSEDMPGPEEHSSLQDESMDAIARRLLGLEPPESNVFIPGTGIRIPDPGRLRAAEGSAGGREGEEGGGGSEVTGWRGTPEGEGGGGPASSGGGEPVRSAWGGRDVVQRSGGSGSGGSDWRGTLSGGGGGGSVSQASSEAAGSSDVRTIEPTKGTSDSVSATTPTERGKGEYTSQPPSSVQIPPPIFVPPPAGGHLDARDMMQCRKCRKWIPRLDMRPVPPEDPKEHGVLWITKRIVSHAVKTLLGLPFLPEGICPNCGTRQEIPEYEYRQYEIRGPGMGAPSG